VTAPEALLLVFASNAVYLIPLFGVVSIGVLLSTVTRNSAAAVVGTIGVVILLVILAQIPGLEGIKPYLLDEQFENWHGLLRTPTDWAPIIHSAWVCALYAVPACLPATSCSCAATSPAARSPRPADPRPKAQHRPSAAVPRADRSARRRGARLTPPRRPRRSAGTGRARDFVAGSEISGQKGVPRAALGDRLALLDASALEKELTVHEHLGNASVGSVTIASRDPAQRSPPLRADAPPRLRTRAPRAPQPRARSARRHPVRHAPPGVAAHRRCRSP